MSTPRDQNGCEAIRPRFQEYLLETLPEDVHARVRAHLAECAACRAALESAREDLALLDSLPEATPPPGLAERTIQAVRTGKAPRARLAWPVLPGALLAAAVLLVLSLGIIYPRLRAQHLEALAQENLMQVGIAFRMYANQSPRGEYPPVAPYPEVWAPDFRVLYPEFLSDPTVLIHPARRDAQVLRREMRQAMGRTPPDYETIARAAAQSYVYTGHMLSSEEDVARLQEERVHVAQGEAPVTRRAPFRLQEGIERFLITDINNPAASAVAQSTVPVLFEALTPETKPHRRMQVLYMDGHVEGVPLGQAFPVLPSVLEQFPPPTFP